MRKAIWRLRNRLIMAYLFIAVVPIILIAALAGIAGYAVIGQMAVYLVNTELSHRVNGLLRPAEALARAPIGDPEQTLRRFVPMIQNGFPEFELRISGHEDLRYPPESQLDPPPPAWKRASGLILKQGGLYAWAHEVANGNEVTILAPFTHQLLAGLIPQLGDANLVAPFTKWGRENRVPAKVSALDFEVAGVVPLQVASWDSPQTPHRRPPGGELPGLGGAGHGFRAEAGTGRRDAGLFRGGGHPVPHRGDGSRWWPASSSAAP